MIQNEVLNEKPFWPIYLFILIKFISKDSPQMTKKMDLNWLPLDTASILGQPPG